MQNILTAICEINELQFISSRPVHGGDINQAYAIDTTKGRFFIKLNSASAFPLMFQKEGKGLDALRKASLLQVPVVEAFGEYQSHQYLLLEWLEKDTMANNFWKDFAIGLATLHKISHTHFGWSSSNYIGSLIQQNNYTDSWCEFYATQRILPLIQKLYDKSLLAKADVHAAEKMCSRFTEIFPSEPPSLLHGDLWSGNYMVSSMSLTTAESKPSVVDPAVYFGHREMDIGMTLLFGGFDKRFYEEYHEVFPLEKNWRMRVALTQLYPLLVHAVLFGGGYVERCKKTLQGF